MNGSMNRSELITKMGMRLPKFEGAVTETATRCILELMSDTLIDRRRIEIRNFGSLEVENMPSKNGRNPKTGETLVVAPRDKIKWRSGKPLFNRLNGIENE